ncbi:unnamed protein product [Brassica rapa subsp. trilocularis]
MMMRRNILSTLVTTPGTLKISRQDPTRLLIYLLFTLKSICWWDVSRCFTVHIGMMSEKWIYGKWCKVFLEATNQELCFKLSDIRRSKVWKDCVWKPGLIPSSVEIVEENVAMDFPFEKKEDCREMSAVGMMLIFSHLGRVLP